MSSGRRKPGAPRNPVRLSAEAVCLARPAWPQDPASLLPCSPADATCSYAFRAGQGMALKYPSRGCRVHGPLLASA